MDARGTGREIGSTRHIADFIATAVIPDAVAQRAVPLVLDTLAVTLAGGREPSVRRLAAQLATDTSVAGVPSFWAPTVHRIEDAALLFGTASHVLDYDDVSMLALCHPSAPVLSALLALSRGTVSGRALIEAFSVGTEVMIRVGQAMGFRPYGLGFHATSIFGSLGAAAACARLMGLAPRRSGHAIAIAASLAGGLRANFGTMVKSLHVGLAASNGLKAAQWAQAGFEGAGEALDGDEGFLHAFSGGETRRLTGVAFGAPFALEAPGFEQKRYPCCYMLHKIAEAILALRRAHRLDLLSVRAVTVLMPPGGSRPLIHPYPRTGLEALFSGPYCVAAGLEDGRIDLASFTDAMVGRPHVQARLADVTLKEREGGPLPGEAMAHAPVTVVLDTVDGRRLEHEVTIPPGSSGDSLTWEQLRGKWGDCLHRAAPHGHPEAFDRLFEAGRVMEAQADIAGWLSDLRAVLAMTGRPHPA